MSATEILEGMYREFNGMCFEMDSFPASPITSQVEDLDTLFNNIYPTSTKLRNMLEVKPSSRRISRQPSLSSFFPPSTNKTNLLPCVSLSTKYVKSADTGYPHGLKSVAPQPAASPGLQSRFLTWTFANSRHWILHSRWSI